MSEFDEGRFYQGLLNQARWYLRRWPTPGVEPEDVVHEAWWRARQASVHDNQWLYRRYLELFIKGVAHRWHEQYTRWKYLPLLDTAPSGEHVEAEALARVELQHWLSTLTNVTNGHLPVLRAMGWQNRELAALLDTSEGAMQARVYYARQRAGLRG